MEREVTLKNEGVAHFTDYENGIDPDDPDQMVYYNFNVGSNNDALVIYVKIKGEIPNDVPVIFTAYFKSGTSPSSGYYDYTYDVTFGDLDDVGYKMFVPSGIIKSGKCVMAFQPKSYIPAVITKRSAPNTTGGTQDIDEESNHTVKEYNADDVNNNTVKEYQLQLNFSIITVTTGCKTYYPTRSAWESKECMVSLI